MITFAWDESEQTTAGNLIWLRENVIVKDTFRTSAQKFFTQK